MNYFEKLLLNYLRGSKIKMEITGFDMDSFQNAVNSGLKQRLETIECIIFEDSGVISDAQKVASIQNLFQREFYDMEFFTKRDPEGARHAMAVHMRHAMDEMGLETG